MLIDKQKKRRPRLGSSLLLFVITTLICSSVQGQYKSFDEYKVDKTFQKYPSYTSQALPTGGQTSTVSIQHDEVIHEVRESLFGTNSAAWQGNVTPTDTREQNWAAADFSLVRFPGGNWSNGFFWDGNMPTSIVNESVHNGNINSLYDGTEGWTLETDEFPDLLDVTGADGIVCVNVGYAFYGTSANPVSTAADYAADWVDYYNNQQGLGVKYWELGNENYGSWQAGYDLADAYQYANACVEFYDKMKAKDPTIEIGVVLYEGYGGLNSNEEEGKDWNERILPIVEDHCDFIVIHHYPHPKSNQNDISEADIYAARIVAEETYEMIHDQVETYTSKPADYYPVAITEYNARAGVRNLSRTNVLFTTMMMGEYAKYDFGAATQWDMQNGYTLDAGDHGSTSNKDPFLDKGDANPELYAHYYMSKYFGDALVESSTSDSDILTYATTFDSGEMGLVLINLGSTDQVVEIDFGDFPKGERMYWHTVNGDFSDFDRTVYINGQGPGTSFVQGQTYFASDGTPEVATAFETNGVSGPQDFENVMPFSSLIPIASHPKMDAPRYSVSYIVFEAVDGDCAIPELGDDFSICGLSSVTLESHLNDQGKTFSWSLNGGAQIGSGADLIISNAGTYAVVVDSNGCISSDFVVVTSDIPSFDFGPDAHLCQSGPVELSSGALGQGLDFDWTHDGLDLFYDEDGLVVSAAGTYGLTLSASGCLSQSDQITFTSDLAVGIGDTVCETGEEVSLEAIGTGDHYWYDSSVDGNLLSSLDVFEAAINASTTYYLEQENTNTYDFGKTSQDGQVWGNTSAGVYDQDTRRLVLNVEKPLTIKSFDIFVNTNTTDVVLTIYGTGGYNQVWNFDNLSNTQHTLNLDAQLPEGIFTVDLSGTDGGIYFQYDNNGDNELPGYISFEIEAGWATDYYGMFYNWVIEVTEGCARTPVEAVIDPNHPDCVLTTINSGETTFENFFPNPTTGLLYLQDVQSYELFSFTGKLLKSGEDVTIDLSDLNAGSYVLKLEGKAYRVVKQ